MDYWGELWLNEGFATYFEHVGATAAQPELGFFDTFFADVASQALDADAHNRSTQPLAVKGKLTTLAKDSSPDWRTTAHCQLASRLLDKKTYTI
jgi:hypothetical protein